MSATTWLIIAIVGFSLHTLTLPDKKRAHTYPSTIGDKYVLTYIKY